MMFSGLGNVAVALPDFAYSASDPLPTASGAKAYRPALSRDQLANLREEIEKWKFETAHFSLRSDRIAVKSFENIISFGQSAIPTIVDDIKREPSFLFLALERLTGEDPVFNEIRGNLRAVVGAWIQWYESGRGLGS